MDENGSNDRFALSIYDGGWNTIYGSTMPTTAIWYHIAFTYDGTIGKLYVNGKQEGGDLRADLVEQSEYWRINAGYKGPSRTNRRGPHL